MIGLVVPLALEARSLGRWARRPSTTEPVRRGELAVRVSGIGADLARAAAHDLVDRSARALISYGTAGALDPSLPAGTLLLPRSVVSETGTTIATDAAWRERFAACCERAPRIEPGSLLQVDRVLATVADKRRARAESGASAIDMESAAIGAVAAERGLPFLCVRAVADEASFPLPRLVLVALDERGRPRPAAIAGALLQRPQDLGATVRVWRSFRRARATLSWVASRAGPSFQARAADSAGVHPETGEASAQLHSKMNVNEEKKT